MLPQLRKDLRASLYDGVAYSLMVGIGESFFAAFAISRGHSPILVSWLTTLPLLAGALIQLFGPLGVRWLGSYHRFVLLAAAGQALVLFLLAGGALHSELSYASLFMVISLYWAFGMAAGPAWNAWLNQIIPVRLRTGFFSRRSRWCHSATFAGLAAGGLTLHLVLPEGGASAWAFSVLFGLAALFRAISVYFLAAQSPSDPALAAQESVGVISMGRAFHQTNMRRFMVFVLIFQTTTNTASAFFTPYMLQELKLNYLDYMVLLAAALGARVITLHFAQSLVQQVDLKRLFWVATLSIAPLPWLWTLGKDYGYLLVLQFLSGFAWGLYELIVFLLLFNGLPQKDRAGVLSFFSLLQTSGIVLGAVAGGVLFSWGPKLGADSYSFVFDVSTLLRFLALMAMPGFAWHAFRLKEWIELRPISVRAHGGLLSRPLIVRIPWPKRRRSNKLNP